MTPSAVAVVVVRNSFGRRQAFPKFEQRVTRNNLDPFAVDGYAMRGRPGHEFWGLPVARATRSSANDSIETKRGFHETSSDL